MIDRNLNFSCSDRGLIKAAGRRSEVRGSLEVLEGKRLLTLVQGPSSVTVEGVEQRAEQVAEDGGPRTAGHQVEGQQGQDDAGITCRSRDTQPAMSPGGSGPEDLPPPIRNHCAANAKMASCRRKLTDQIRNKKEDVLLRHVCCLRRFIRWKCVVPRWPLEKTSLNDKLGADVRFFQG